MTPTPPPRRTRMTISLDELRNGLALEQDLVLPEQLSYDAVARTN